MKKLLLLAAIGSVAATVHAAEIGVSVTIAEPGLYGRIDIGRFPQPELVFAKPVIVVPAAPNVVVQPLYLRVPPGHEKHWDKHCKKYNACGYPVYFVRENWYKKVYEPGMRREHGRDEDHKEHGKGHGKGHDKD
ncbi:MAG: hypothetical protein HY255_00150 [Betaproteobacteria bacterium]|nr:hypothetical protein [Betaproteobacteria bacterium]